MSHNSQPESAGLQPQQRFKWILTGKYDRWLPLYYKTAKINVGPLELHKEFGQGEVVKRICAPNTAFAKVTITQEFAEGAKPYLALYRHFQGKSAFRDAKRWCEFLLKNAPRWYTGI